MPQLIPWSEWRPDVDAYRGQHSPNIVNAIPRGDGYGPMKDSVALTAALPAACRGFFVALDDDNTVVYFAATASRLYKLSNTNFTWADISKDATASINLSGANASAYIGDMTGDGGLDEAFDTTTTATRGGGQTAQVTAATGYVGATLATTAPIHKAVIMGSSDQGFVNAANPSVTIKLYAKNGNAPANGTDGTLLGTVTFTDTANESAGRTITSTDASTPYKHVWVLIDPGGSVEISCAEVQVFTAFDYSLASDAQWQFAQYGTTVLATHGANVLQSFVMGTSDRFADTAGSPPQAKYIAVVGEFVVLSGLTSDPYTIHWSSRDNPAEWTSGTNEGDVQSFKDGGLVRGIAGGEYGLVFQDAVIRRMLYQPGSPLVFSFDRVCDNLGLLGPYTIVRARDNVMFLSNNGFQKWNPSEGFTAIGKERVDRTFFDDCDLDNKYLLIGAGDIAATRAMWVYKSKQGLAGQFDRAIIYDWQLDRWARIISTGEYLTRGAVPGVTLENLDTINSSLDALEVSLDSFPADFGQYLALADTDHKIGLFNGAPKEAILETATVVGDTRVFIQGARPITDAATVYGSVSTLWQKNPDQVVMSSESLINDVGFTPHRIDTRLARFRNRIPAGTDWHYSIGVEPMLVNSGLR